MVAGSILGNRVLRKEDPKFLTIGGKYIEDLNDEPLLADALHVTYVRSTVAHGKITNIDLSECKQAPGVIAVFTADDLGLEPVSATFNPMAKRTYLAKDKVRWVGEPVAAIVTQHANQGEDAAERAIIDYETLEPLIDVEIAMTSTTLIYEECGSNVVMDTIALGIPDNTGDAIFKDCEVVVKGRFMNQRVAPCPLEARGSAVAWIDGRLYQWISTQHAQGVREEIRKANGLELENVRIITPDVGGGFGAKISAYSEELLLGAISKHVGKPVRWRETRSESMVGLGHGRAQLQFVTIGGTKAGRVTAYQLHAIQDSGGWVDIGTILAPFMTRPMSQGVYDIAAMECRTTSVVTNTTPIVAYRGAGRPEASAAIERAMDLFAAEIGKDPVEVRRMNLIPKFMEPYQTKIGAAYDVGDYAAALEKALAVAKYTEARTEQAVRRKRGDTVQLGIGVSVYVEITGGVDPKQEHAKINILPNGRAVVYTGTSPHGQGHVTSWAMIASSETGISIEDIDVVWGDTDLVPSGGGTMGSRSLQQGGAAVQKVSIELVDEARKLAARLMEANESDVVLDKTNGSFHVAGTPAVSKSWADVAQAADPTIGLTQEGIFVATSATFPFGAHVAIVEVDIETGQVTHRRHIACDDAGKVINPLILEGQIHGGIAQGTAQALLEEFRYDDDGNPITSNFADYAIISAVELPSIEVVHMETPTFVNPLGAKGIGESGTIGSTPAVQSAVIDALMHLGVRHIDMPTTPERVWSAIATASV
ncbi:MAG: xanthine dehydrogenase family protein molybdopterin-binding subunit [Acidimicrobiaceae bacterium]|nr:xanthine dehydrogenase family protein molybdopterin-binding subunit [Acidimicrobiaceae bacterium]